MKEQQKYTYSSGVHLSFWSIRSLLKSDVADGAVDGVEGMSGIFHFYHLLTDLNVIKPVRPHHCVCTLGRGMSAFPFKTFCFWTKIMYITDPRGSTVGCHWGLDVFSQPCESSGLLRLKMCNPFKNVPKLHWCFFSWSPSLLHLFFFFLLSFYYHIILRSLIFIVTLVAINQCG